MRKSTVSRMASKGAGRLAASVVLSVCLALSCAPLAMADVIYLPGVVADMSDPAYWTAKQKDPDAVLATRAEIDAINQGGIDADGTMLQPLKQAREYFYDAGQQENLKSSAESDLKSMMGWTYNSEGNDFSEEDAAKILANFATDGKPPAIQSQYAIVTTHTTMRSFPSDDMILDESPEDLDSDQLYTSLLRVNEPLVIRTVSLDGNYFMCISSCLTGWVPAKDVAICKDKQEWLDAWDIPEGQELVVWGHKVRTEDSRTAATTANRLLYMGTVLERIDPADAQQLVGGRSVYNNHVCYLPVRDADGNYAKQPALISESARVSEGYLPLTKANIAKVAFNALGAAYGWGGMLQANDCSGYMRDVYKCFGLELARNTNWQQNMPVRKYDLSGLDDSHKAAAIAQMPLGTILYFPGHEMMYLGQVGSDLYVISSLGTIGNQFGESGANNVRSVAVNKLDMIRGDRSTWLSNLDAAILPYVSSDVPAVALNDIAFYENAVNWPQDPIEATGSPIEPDIAVAGLAKGDEYKVSFANNVYPGQATILIEGQGTYTGSMTRTFTIFSSDDDQVKAAIVSSKIDKLPDAETIAAGAPETLAQVQEALDAFAALSTVQKSLIGAERATALIEAQASLTAVEIEQAAKESEEAAQKAAADEIAATKRQAADDVAAANRQAADDVAAAERDAADKVAEAQRKAASDVESAKAAAARTDLSGAIVRVAKATYTGKVLKPTVKVELADKALKSGTDYKVTYANNKKAGTGVVVVKGIGKYAGAAVKTFSIAKAKNSLTVKAKTVTFKAAKLKKKAASQKAAKAFKVKRTAGKLAYKKVSGNKKIAVAANGKITAKEGLAKKTYKVKVKVTAKASANYKAASKTVTLKVRVK